jgi:DNA-binding beta-propeller fold protein YncE
MMFDADGLLYVVDSRLNKVIVLDRSANVVRNIEAGTFLFPTGVAFNQNNNKIYVADPHQGQISIINENGLFISKFGEFGNSLSQLNVPPDIVFDSKKHAVVNSMNNGTLEVYRITDTIPSARFRTGNTVICSGETTSLEISYTGTVPGRFDIHLTARIR